MNDNDLNQIGFPRTILGSASPRRRELLQRLGVSFEVQVAEVDEDIVTVVDPAANVLARAELKGAALAAVVGDEIDVVLITADTVVADGLTLLNKPADPQEAMAMLRQLRGRSHQVHTAVVVRRLGPGQKQVVSDICTTTVHMRPYDDDEIAAYVASGDPFDKAGGYAIQHSGFRPVAKLSGCYTSVVGFPLCRVTRLLSEVGFPLSRPAKRPPLEWENCDICTALWTG